MTTYAVTGATGKLGQLAVEGLLDRGVDPADVVAIVRTPGRAAGLAQRGVTVRAGDYDEPRTLPAALAGVEALLLVSGSEPGRRLPQHRAVIEAAQTAGVGRLVYTSLLRADTTALSLAPEHKATEELLIASGLPYTLLRNGWYTENYTDQLAQYLRQGAIVDAAGEGRVSAATRADYAAAAVAVLTGTGHDNVIYELGGPAFTMDELAATITDVTGTAVAHKTVTVPELIAILEGAGLDAGTAGFVARLDEGTARGDLYTGSEDLPRLLGRPATPLADAVRAAA
jgi:NAD(P)H dehydrogenase (quinone)